MDFYEKYPQLSPSFPQMKPYLAELRQQYDSQVYDIDPYVEVFRIRENIYALNAPCTHAMGDNWIYLVDGPETALFIDNGYGVGNLKGLGELLTGKEVITAPTHNHGDHSGGSSQFDKVYCHKYCADILKSHMYPEFWGKFNHVGEPQHRHYYDDKDLLPFKSYEPIACESHFIINLGEDYDIELIHVGGHAPGLCCFLDKKSRILFAGDAMFEARAKGLAIGLHAPAPDSLHAECMSAVFYREQLAQLVDRIDEFDCVLAGHGFLDSPSQVAVDTLKAVDAVLANPGCYDHVIERHGQKTYIKEGGMADVMYCPDEIEQLLAQS